MSEIYFKIDALDRQIEKLKQLKEKCEEYNKNATKKVYDMVGSGDTIELMHQMDQTSYDISEAVYQLLLNSEYFFGNIKTSMLEADKKAADAMSR